MVGMLFLLGPSVVVHLVLGGVAHDDDLAAKGLFALFDEQGEWVADPVQLGVWG